MKRLTKEEAEQIRIKPSGKGSIARKLLMSMEVGEIILLEPADWNQRKRTPGTYCLQLGRKVKRKWNCGKAMDRPGWVIERME